MVVAVLTRVVAVLTRVVAVLECRRFGVSPFWRVAVFVVAVPTCRRYDQYPMNVRNLVLGRGFKVLNVKFQFRQFFNLTESYRW